MSPEQICRRYQPQCLPVLKRVVVGGEDLDDAKATFEQQQGGRPIISFTFNSAGGRAFCAATRANIGKRLAIQLDGEIISAPVVQSAICGGSGIITGTFTTQQTQEQALLLRSGALPATLTIIEERTVGADLGADAIRPARWRRWSARSWWRSSMFVAYGPVFGGFANLAMLVNLLMVFAGMSILGASLTLPGIAGLVLTVGMSVDSNVLIYERVREEKALGRSPSARSPPATSAPCRPIIDANLTTLIAGVLLFGFGSGPDPRLRHHPVARPAHLDVQLDHLHPHAAGGLGALAAADRTRDLRRSHAVEARSPVRASRRSSTSSASARLALDPVDADQRRWRSSGVVFVGLNFGIDFKGGIAIQVRAKQGAAQLDELRATVGGLGVGEVSLQEFGDASTVLIRVQRQEGNAQCVAGAQRVMQKRAGAGWQVKPGAAGTGDVEFTSPPALDARRLARRGEPRRPHHRRSASCRAARPTPPRSTCRRSSAPNGASRSRSSWSRTRSAASTSCAAPNRSGPRSATS